MLVALLMAVFAVVISLVSPRYYGNSLTNNPSAAIFIVVIMAIFGFVIGLLEGYFLRNIKLKPWLNDGILGIIFVIIFSLVLSLFTFFVTARHINALPIFIFSFLIWIVPGFLFGILNGFVLRKLNVN